MPWSLHGSDLENFRRCFCWYFETVIIRWFAFVELWLIYYSSLDLLLQWKQDVYLELLRLPRIHTHYLPWDTLSCIAWKSNIPLRKCRWKCWAVDHSWRRDPCPSKLPHPWPLLYEVFDETVKHLSWVRGHTGHLWGYYCSISCGAYVYVQHFLTYR